MSRIYDASSLRHVCSSYPLNEDKEINSVHVIETSKIFSVGIGMGWDGMLCYAWKIFLGCHVISDTYWLAGVSWASGWGSQPGFRRFWQHQWGCEGFGFGIIGYFLLGGGEECSFSPYFLFLWQVFHRPLIPKNSKVLFPPSARGFRTWGTQKLKLGADASSTSPRGNPF